MKRVFLWIIGMLLCLQTIHSQESAFRWNATGLEVDDYKQLKLVIAELQKEDLEQWKLTESQIRQTVEDKLKSFKITPLSKKDYTVPYRLHVGIQILDTAFQLKVAFERVVIFRVGKQEYHNFATVFQRETLGINSKKDNSHIFRVLDRLLDQFAREFVKVNQKS
ncbi:MAG: hypothetical protein HQM14_11100 [SAR324 cluster bacterium]|nr:hypothetical protein [SAR324 cluster bacterium]